MDRHDAIKNAYKSLGVEADFYDGMIHLLHPAGEGGVQAGLGHGKKENDRYLEWALSGNSEDFSGTLLEVPVGTGVLTVPVYRTLPQADITCLDYSPDMMAAARRRAKAEGLGNVRFRQGDVGALPFGDGSFDVVLPLNGFHAFPDKEAAYREIYRVLRPGGTFCGCFYIKGENRRADWFVDKLYTPRGFFTPPYETADSLCQRLEGMYTQSKVETGGKMK